MRKIPRSHGDPRRGCAQPQGPLLESSELHLEGGVKRRGREGDRFQGGSRSGAGPLGKRRVLGLSAEYCAESRRLRNDSETAEGVGKLTF